MEQKYPAWLEGAALSVLLLNIPIIILESFNVSTQIPLNLLEWVFTGLYTIEYLLRTIIAKPTRKYTFSFWGVVDFLATIPQYLLLFFTGLNQLFLLRFLRLGRLLLRLMKAGKSGASVIRNFLQLKEHYMNGENVVSESHMSRIYYLGMYSLLSILGIASGVVAVFFEGPELFGLPSIRTIGYMVLVICIIGIIAKELKVASYRYAVTNHRLLLSTKLLDQHVTSISLLHMTDLSLTQSFIQRIFKVGSVEARTSGEVTSIKLTGIKNPAQVKQSIENAIVDAKSAAQHLHQHPSA